MNDFRLTLTRNIGWLFLEKLVRIFSSLTIGLWVARYLGPNDFGILTFSLAYVALFSFLVDLGIDQVLIRRLASKPDLSRIYLGTVFTIRLMGSMFAIALLVGSVYFFEVDDDTRPIILVIGLGLLVRCFDGIAQHYQAQYLSAYICFAKCIGTLFAAILRIIFIMGSYDLFFFALASSLELAVASFGLVAIYTKKIGGLGAWKFDVRIAKNMVRDSWPLALILVLTVVHTRVDQVMLGALADARQVGLYGLTVWLVDAWIFIPSVLAAALTPYLVQLRDTAPKLYELRLVELYSLMFWMGVLVSLVTIIFGRQFINILVGESFSDAYFCLVINIWNVVFVSLGISRGIWLLNEGLQKYRLYNNIAAVILNIISNALLIPVYGAVGAAVATVISQGLTLFLLSYLWVPLRKSNLSIMRSMNPMYLYRFYQSIRLFNS